jgi:hypothetical protein
MGIGKSLADWTTLHLARFLAARPAALVLVTGTLVLAAVGAAVTAPAPSHQSRTVGVRTTPTSLPTYPNSSCHIGRFGAIACRMPASLIASYPQAYCWWYPHGASDGVYVCYFLRH